MLLFIFSMCVGHVFTLFLMAWTFITNLFFSFHCKFCLYTVPFDYLPSRLSSAKSAPGLGEMVLFWGLGRSNSHLEYAAVPSCEERQRYTWKYPEVCMSHGNYNHGRVDVYIFCTLWTSLHLNAEDFRPDSVYYTNYLQAMLFWRRHIHTNTSATHHAHHNLVLPFFC